MKAARYLGALFVAGMITTGTVWVRLGSTGAPIVTTGFKSTRIFQDTRTVVDQPLEFPGYRNLFTVVLKELAPGAQTGRHKHLVLSFVYVSEGTLTLEVEGHGKRRYKAGEGFAAPLNVWYDAANHEATTLKYLVVYVGNDEQRIEEWPQEGESRVFVSPGDLDIIFGGR